MAPFLSWLFGGEPPRQPPPRVPTDTVIKLGVMENSLMMKSLYSRYTHLEILFFFYFNS